MAERHSPPHALSTFGQTLALFYRYFYRFLYLQSYKKGDMVDNRQLPQL